MKEKPGGFLWPLFTSNFEQDKTAFTLPPKNALLF